MPSFEHPIEQPIKSVTVVEYENGYESYTVGSNGITKIEACTKSGMHADIPYVRVWKSDICIAEFCQHNIQGVYFAAHPSAPEGGKE